MMLVNLINTLTSKSMIIHTQYTKNDQPFKLSTTRKVIWNNRNAVKDVYFTSMILENNFDQKNVYVILVY